MSSDYKCEYYVGFCGTMFTSMANKDCPDQSESCTYRYIEDFERKKLRETEKLFNELKGNIKDAKLLKEPEGHYSKLTPEEKKVIGH